MTTVTRQEVEEALDAFYEKNGGRSWRSFRPVRTEFALAAMKKRLILEKKQSCTKSVEQDNADTTSSGSKEPGVGVAARRRSHSRSTSAGRSHSRSRSRSLLRGSSPPRSSRSSPPRSRKRRRNRTRSPSGSSSSCSPIIRSRSQRRSRIITISSSSSSSASRSRSPSPTHVELAQRSPESPARRGCLSTGQYINSWESPPGSPLLGFSSMHNGIQKRARPARA